MKIGMIAAASPDRVIGIGPKIPWDYPEDFKYFKRQTSGCTIIMGRRTWESLPVRPLPNRKNVIISTRMESKAPDFVVYGSLQVAIEQERVENEDKTLWLIGGAGIYREGLAYADFICLTQIPDRPDPKDPNAVFFPEIDPELWVVDATETLDPGLTVQTFVRRARVIAT